MRLTDKEIEEYKALAKFESDERAKYKKEEAIKILENILAMNPDQDKFAVAENRSQQRFSRLLYNKLKKEK